MHNVFIFINLVLICYSSSSIRKPQNFNSGVNVYVVITQYINNNFFVIYLYFLNC